MGISALISLISGKIQRSMPERACPSSSGGCLRDAPALRGLGTRQERDVELGSGAARLHQELPRGNRGARAQLHPALQPGPSAPAHVVGSPPRSGTSAAPGRWKHPDPTYRQGPPRGRRSSAETFGAGGELPRRTGCFPSQLVQSVLFRLSALPPRVSSSRAAPKVGERAAARSALRHPWAPRNKTPGFL